MRVVADLASLPSHRELAARSLLARAGVGFDLPSISLPDFSGVISRAQASSPAASDASPAAAPDTTTTSASTGSTDNSPPATTSSPASAALPAPSSTPAAASSTANIVGGALQGLISAIGQIASNVPAIEAASGLKSAQTYEAQQAAARQALVQTQSDNQVRLAQAQGSGTALKIAAGVAGSALGLTLLAWGVSHFLGSRR